MNELWRQVVALGFRLLYQEMAFTYDVVSWTVSMGEWRCWQRAALKHLNVGPGSRVLELAHGPGHLQLDLRSAGLNPVGLDFSPQMGEMAYGKLTRHHIPPKLVRGRAQTLPFATASFGVIVSTFPTEFIIDPLTISEAYRVLKPGGRLVFVPNGVLTRGGVAQQGIEAAYRATGQSGSWPVQVRDRFAAVGFTITQFMEKCPASVAQVVIAEKPAESPSGGPERND